MTDTKYGGLTVAELAIRELKERRAGERHGVVEVWSEDLRALLSAVEGKGRETCDAVASPRPSTAEKALREALATKAQDAFDAVAEWPERRGDRIEVGAAGFADLLELRNIVPELIAALASPSTEGEKLWLWRDGKDRFLAFRSLFPTMPDGGDPAVLGQPSGYAFYHPMTLAEAQAASFPEPKASTS